MTFRIIALIAGLSWAIGARAITPADKCEAAKDTLAGKYAACRQNAEAKAIKTGKLPVYTGCDNSLVAKWVKAETKANGACPTNGDAAATQAFLTSTTDKLAAAVAGAGIPRCGNGAIDVAGEQCDGPNLGGVSCTSLGFLAGTLTCDAGCKLDTSACQTNKCGNGTKDGIEGCDGADLGSESCTALGFAAGILACKPNCQLDTSGCINNLCGNGTQNGNEACDGADLGGQSCISLGFLGGTLACNGLCQFNTAGCTNNLCGNGTRDGNEGCDGADLGGASCTTLGFASGTLACKASCQIDTSACQVSTTTCGNGVKQGNEQCDGADLGGQTCASLGYTVAGTLGCTAGCAFNTSGCIAQAFATTGQIYCSAASGGAVVPCAGTGQDGEIRAGAPFSYNDNGDGTITDLNTGLVWEKKSDDGSIHDKDNTYSWGNTFSVFIAGVNAANFAGHHDWRLPNAKELASLADYQLFSPAVSPTFVTSCPVGCSVTACNCVQTTWYWASTSYAGNNNAVWAVNFNDGTLADGSKLQGLYARAVRGGLPGTPNPTPTLTPTNPPTPTATKTPTQTIAPTQTGTPTLAPTCSVGFADCNNNPADGCETATSTNVNNCGSCGNVCSAAHGTSSCIVGGCHVASCNAGFGDCNNNASDGCETATNSDPNNCGSCANVCSTANGTSSCIFGGCHVASCNAGFGDCNNDPADGCETSTTTNPFNCGGCGNNCTALANVSAAACAGGTCTVVGCNAGFLNCNNDSADGCETNPLNDVNNCGACGHVCSGATPTCTGGTCH
ncbi:MAG: DUF1566 domain-containing protein [Deltaproteobacteria bacterium]|nr:DUF1566 domain-containing protein [Deltaproteobacteria bacterium]